MSLPFLRPIRFLESNDIQNVDLFAILVGEGDIHDRAVVSEDLKGLDRTLGGVVEQLVSLGDFEGKWLQTSLTLCPQKGVAARVMLVGVGSARDNLPNRARQLGLAVAEEAQKRKGFRIALGGNAEFCGNGELREHLALGFQMGHYTFPKFNETDKDREGRERAAELFFAGAVSGAAPRWNRVEALAESIDLCRLLQDYPPNVATPKFVAEVARERAERRGLSFRVMGAEKLKEMGMNAMLAVGGASAHEPQLVVVEYKPEKYTRTLALVGKGLTFDSGGYSLKPADSMTGMKYDMSGAAVVLSAVEAIAALKLPVHVFAVAALCENMIDAHGYRVDDIIKTYSGKTIEILNTDAEGRVVLADALSYTVRELKPDQIVEFSTLTGAILIALGKYGAGLFTFNSPELEKQLHCAAAGTGERLWSLPVWEEMVDDMKGTLADLNNMGATARAAGSSCAAAFLNEFVEGKPYAHIDIAGVANDNRMKGYPRKTGSGFGVQLSVELARELSEEK